MTLGHLPSWPGTLLAGALGGQLATWAGWPLPWMIGALLAVIAVRCGGWRVTDPPHGRQTGQLLIALGIGLHFTRDVLAEVLAHLLPIAAGVCLTLLLSLIGIALLRRAGVDRATAFFASLPGGASEMANLAARHGATVSHVAAAHSLRLLLVVLVVPAAFAFGLPPVPSRPLATDWHVFLGLLPAALLAARLLARWGLPNPWMFGPLLTAGVASAALDLHLATPALAAGVGQWLIGCSLACHFDRDFFRRAPGFLLQVLLFVALAMLAAAALATSLGQLAGLDPIALTLGMMPGGITELCLTAEALHRSVALVTAVQVLRLFAVLMLAEPLFRLWQRRAAAAR